LAVRTGTEEIPEVKEFEIKAFHAIWWMLAVLLPDLLAFATRDWRAAVIGAAAGAVMIVLSLRVFMRGDTTRPEIETTPLGG
jgi:hypothetical protein